MDSLKPSTDYDYGQMMGMLFIIRFLKCKQSIPAEVLDKIERKTTDSLGEYLQKPGEDVVLMVDRMVEKI